MRRTEAHLNHARWVIKVMPWVSGILLLAFPVHFSNGLAPAPYLGVAILSGLLWLVVLMKAYRTARDAWIVLCFLPPVLGFQFSKGFYGNDLPFSYFLQWLTIFFAMAGVPMVICRERILRYCEL